MSFWELLAFAGILGIFITVYGIVNGRNTRKILTEEAKHTREILSRMEQEQTEARKETREILSTIAEGQTEARKETAEMRREMAEAIKFLGQLIVSESKKNR